ncbi:MAG: NDP-sugar synthase, partial [Candidatus Aegiribacteria sp.]|nr:NDP-sugar synthase [Candidatus Aegiribacteria sp.]
GDNLTRQPVKSLHELHSRLNSEITIALSPTGEPSGKGIVITEPDGRISSFREKPPPELAESNMANSGIYICRSSAVSHIEDGSFSDFGLDVFPELLREGRTLAADTPGGYTRDIGSLENYLLACHDVLSGQVKLNLKPEGMSNGVLIENRQSYDKIKIRGTLWVQEGATIESGCFLENCVVLSGAKVRHNSALKNALVLPDSDVDEGTTAIDKYLSIF